MKGSQSCKELAKSCTNRDRQWLAGKIQTVQNFAKSASGALQVINSQSHLGINGGFKSQKLLGFGALFLHIAGVEMSVTVYTLAGGP